MSRPSWDRYFMNIAEVVATRATCSRLQVGAVIVNPQLHVVGTGYNGVEAGEEHCDHSCNCSGGNQRGETYPGWWHKEECRVNQPCTRAVHSEANAIYHSPTDILDYATMYCTHAPCLSCSHEIVWHDLKRVVYLNEYRKTDGLEYLVTNGVDVQQLT